MRKSADSYIFEWTFDQLMPFYAILETRHTYTHVLALSSGPTDRVRKGTISDYSRKHAA